MSSELILPGNMDSDDTDRALADNTGKQTGDSPWEHLKRGETLPEIEVFYGMHITKMMDALRGKKMKKIQKVCERELRHFYKLPEAQYTHSKVIRNWDSGDRHGLVGWALQAMWFGFFDVPDKTMKRFMAMVDPLIELLRTDENPEVLAASLYCLGEMGPLASRRAIQAGVVTKFMTHKEEIVRESARHCANHSQGRPPLPKAIVRNIRQLGYDIPAYVEANAYVKGADEHWNNLPASGIDTFHRPSDEIAGGRIIGKPKD